MIYKIVNRVENDGLHFCLHWETAWYMSGAYLWSQRSVERCIEDRMSQLKMQKKVDKPLTIK